MSTSILIIGESGTGKSTAIRTLKPEETYIINIIDKPLPFKGWSKLYNAEDKEKINYYASDEYNTIIACLNRISKERPHIKTVIIDDFQYIMANEFMWRALEKGYSKFTEIGKHAWEVITFVQKCRKDLIVIFLSHSEVSEKDGKSRAKTIGKLLNEKVTLEGLFTVVFQSFIKDEGYVFKTQGDEHTIAKSPLDMFNDAYIPNDLQLVIDSVNDYNKG